MTTSKLKIQIHGKNAETQIQDQNLEFANSGYALSRTIEINSTRGSQDELISEELDKKDLVEFEFEDGTIWVTPSPEISTLFPSNNRSQETGTFIPNALEIPTENRSIVRKVYLKFVKIFKPAEKVAEVSAMVIAAKIESGIVGNEGVTSINASFKLSPFTYDKSNPSIEISKPVLFFLHGTSSSTDGSFGEMAGTETWDDFHKFYGNNILGLEHRTWTKSPFENALDALKALPKNTKLHLISHSRGGLVGEVLCRCSSIDSLFSKQEIKLLKDLGRDKDVAILNELNKVARQKNIVVEKFVRVACPAAGTTILSKRIDHFLNILLNVIGFGTGLKTNPLFVGIKSLLLAIVEQRTDPNVLPGLECMVPSTPLLKILNNHQIKIHSDLAVIAGNAGMGGVKKTLMTIMSKLFYRLDNDFVVDTDSMYMGVVRENDIYYKFADGGAVDHFCYFKNKNSRNDIFTAITSPPFDSPPQFKTAARGERNRNITTILPGGSLEPTPVSGDRPIVIVIPGIMGSNLSNGDSEIWIDYFKMAGGRLSQLHMGNENIEAKSVVGTAYGKLVNDLNEKYDVVVFPYDWRKSLTDSGKLLAAKIEELLPKNKDKDPDQPIHIIAHSMGGLVTRDLMMNHKDTWDRLNAIPYFKCILLGTPWQGSYGISEIITGSGGQIKSISRLALFQSRKDLLKIFVRYKGLLELLPIYEGAHDFDDLELWKMMQVVTDDSLWALPNQKDLDEFKAYKKKFHQFKNWNLDKVFYIAGKADQTLSNFVCRDQFGGIINEKNTELLKTGIAQPGLFTHKNYELVFEATGEGDGSVTWDTGIPKQLESHQIFYADTSHGELANDKNRFEAIKDILANGSTNRLPHKRPTSRAIQSVVLAENKEVLTNDVNILAKNILGLNTDPIYQTKNNETQTEIKVIVKNGHLRYATYPILVGHFKDDGIVSAEYAIDSMLNHKLSEREEFGLYPGNIGTNLVHLEDQMHDIGVIVVGLGSVEDLTPFKLSETIELGCLEYLLSVCKQDNKTSNDKIGISTLLIGSNYANLSLNNSINAILEGIINANKKVQNMGVNLPIIGEIEFIELYKDKADETFFTLNQIQKRNSFYQIELEHPLERVDGARSFLPLNSQQEWWRRITATIKTDQIKNTKHLAFSASTGRAMVEINESFANLHIIDALLDDNKKQTNWDRELTKAVFELLIPNEFKISFKNQQNILLILDHKTASYPWELLNYDENLEVPIVVSAGMIRQLATSHSRKMIKPVIKNSALIIGDPILDKKSGVPQLPEAAVEAKMVDRLLQAHGYETTPRIQEPFQEIFKKLYDEYKIIHIASHGVIDYGEDKKTGILLSNNIVLTAAEINQISSTPELVFINSCYMGEVNSDKEKYFRGKYKLAANIGIQFIENGVKAVVVAGWAVDDTAAKRFAEVFYDRMLAGENFANAVKAARATCFREFPRTNTWGAYQCYGDQYYQLVKKPQKSGDAYHYILEKEILIDLENFIDDTKSNRKRKDNFLEKLQLISRGIDDTNLRNARITELEIRAYVELQEYEIALQKFEILFKEKEANFSVKALELWCNCKIKVLSKMSNSIDKKLLRKELARTSKKMNDLLELGETSERHNLMGSIQKRRFMIFDKIKEQRKALIDSADHYRMGYDISKEMYSLTSWIIAEKLVNDEKRMSELDKIFGKNTLTYIEDLLDNLTDNKKNHDEFWDIIKPVNLKQVELLFYVDENDDKKAKISANLKKRKSIVTTIKDLYSQVWKNGGGSPRHIASEILQMDFILKSLKVFEKAKPVAKRRNLETTINAMNELINFFKGLR